MIKTVLIVWGIGAGAVIAFFGVAAWRTRHNPTPLEYGEEPDGLDD